jgi:hypothetical protein
VLAYPTALFIDRAGLVRSIHTGFAGPATGVQHDVLVRDFELQIEALLAGSSANLPVATDTGQAAPAASIPPAPVTSP